MTTWYEEQISLGYLKVAPPPKGIASAPLPLKDGLWYISSRWPKQAHTLIPGRDYSFCGRELLPDDEVALATGYDLFCWIVIYDPTTFPKVKLCKDCQVLQERWRPVEKKSLPKRSPISEEEWAAAVGPSAMMEAKRLNALAAWITTLLPGAEVEEGIVRVEE